MDYKIDIAMNIFESEDEVSRSQPRPQPQPEANENAFILTQQQRLNINKRMPRGFCLMRKQDYDKLEFKKAPELKFINYEPVKVARTVDLNNPIIKVIDQSWSQIRQEELRRNSRFTLQSTFEGRSRQSEKIKNIIQRFRKLIKNTAVQAFLNKVGYMPALNYIEIENKKGLLSIDSFKNRYMVVLENAKNITYELEIISQIDDMIEEFTCYVEQARKAEFENNIQSIQKSIDKITRYLSETTDAKGQGNWYIRRKKKGERNDNYSEKEIMYFGDLVRKLPPAYLVGIWEIIYERPFTESERRLQLANLSEIGNKKLRDIEVYVKGKLSQLYRSRERKKEKIEEKRRLKEEAKLLQESRMIKGQAEGELAAEKPLQSKLVPSEQSQLQMLNNINIEIEQAKQFQIRLQGGEQKEERAQRNPADGQPAQNQAKQNEPAQLEDSMDANNSSDSSMITDQDESDF